MARADCVCNERIIASRPEWFPLFKKEANFFSERVMTMKRFLTLTLITVMGVSTIGCDSQKGTTESKTETKTTQTKDGVTTGETTTKFDTKTTTTPGTPGESGTTTKSTETKTETTTEKPSK